MLRVWLWSVMVHLPCGLPTGSAKDRDTAQAEFRVDRTEQSATARRQHANNIAQKGAHTPEVTEHCPCRAHCGPMSRDWAGRDKPR